MGKFYLRQANKPRYNYKTKKGSDKSKCKHRPKDNGLMSQSSLVGNSDQQLPCKNDVQSPSDKEIHLFILTWVIGS